MQGATEGSATAAVVQPAYAVVVQHAPDGVVIHVSGQGDRQGGLDAESVVAFLSSLDAEQLEKDVLGGLGMLEDEGETSFTVALLQRLITIAKGEW